MTDTATPSPSSSPQPPAPKIYRGLWKVLVERLRVPQQPPEVPGRSVSYSEQFQPDPGFLRYLKFSFWIVWTIIDLSVLGCWAVIWFAEWWVALLLTPLVLVLLIVPPLVFYIAVHLRFDTTWYVMTDSAVRIRRGIWIIREKTITFENVQNVKVTQGPLQRLFNIATVKVETAGVGSAAGQQNAAVGNYGLIEGVANAPEIRDRILQRLRESTSAGLGDEQRFGQADRRRHTFSPMHLDLLRAIRDELASNS